MTRNRVPIIEVLLSAVVTLVSVLPADDFPPIYNNDQDQDAQPMSAAEAAAGMQVPDGLQVNVFASEPDVQNPIDMSWDTRGRLWIAENYTYADRSQHFDLTLRDRVLILEDQDRDGICDRRVVFSDQVQMLTSVEVGHGGVWLMCPPQLLFIPDRDRDDIPDGPAVVVLDGFTVARENYHNFANGLRWGPDGWLYGRCGGSCPGRVGIPGTPDDRRVALEGGIWRYHPFSRHFEVLTHGTTNPWGHDWNQWGDGFFINTVNGHLWQLIPGAHLHRPFTLDPNPHVYELLDMHADHWHFDTGQGWTNSRDGAANAYGGGHAHCGMMIYLGDNWPAEYRGRLLTWNIHGRRANQELLERVGSGYVGHHGQDMLLSVDPFFRGMDLNYGPDGAVYVIDWSDTGECHEHTGVHRTSGRVYRIAHAPIQSQATVDLHSLQATELVQLMRHRNEWFPRQARLVLAERARATDRPSAKLARAIDELQQLVAADEAQLAYRALVTLHAMGATDSTLLRSQLDSEDEHIRAWAIRLLTDDWPIDDIFGPPNLTNEVADRVDAHCRELLPELRRLAASDTSGLVRLALASTLPRMPVRHRTKLAEALVVREEDRDDHNLPLLVWYGLIPVAAADPDQLVTVAIQSRWPKTQRLIARRLAELIDTHPAPIERLLDFVVDVDDSSVRHNLLQGLSDGTKGWRRAPQPANWPSVVSAVSSGKDEATHALVRELSLLFGDGRAVDEVRELVLDNDAPVDVRRSALETLVARGTEDIHDICMAVLDDARLNVAAAQGLAQSTDPGVAQALVKNYRKFRSPYRPRVIEILVSRPAFASALLDAIQKERIPADDLTAYDVRQIRSLPDSSLHDRVLELWGEVRDSPEAKRQQIAALKSELGPAELATADSSRGRYLFERHCAKCHKLFGQGEAVGPDLTGGNRNNLDYLLENIVDPSAVVSKDFRMSVIQTADGRTLNGLVVTKNDKTLTLQTQTDQLTILLESIEAAKDTTLSPMPDGLLDNLSPEEIRHLFCYLMQPAQVPLPPASVPR